MNYIQKTNQEILIKCKKLALYKYNDKFYNI